MKIIDSHFHWWPSSVLKTLSRRDGFPRADPNESGGYTYKGADNRPGQIRSWEEWYDLDAQLEAMDKLGHDVSVVLSIGPLSVAFSELDPQEGRDLALQWNEEMAWAQRRYAGRVWASAAIPLVDERIAMDTLEDAVSRLGLMGVNLPGSIGADPHIDAPRLEPFYARLAELGLPAFLHPTDATFASMLEGYGGALHLSLGRVIEVSVGAMRHPGLKIVMSHTGGALPYQAGRMDKNGRHAKLPQPPSSYMRRMYTDTVSPHTAGMRFALDFYGIDRVMYGTDYPCWDPKTCLQLLDDIELDAAQKQKLFWDNAVRILGLKTATFPEEAMPETAASA
jgi:aminocarboxymuconate-semialdehyde decarboxylase